MLVGLKILIIIALMGGIIAYMGDKLGTKIGKRRMSLFGLRPKHTSIIVTIVTGLLVAAATVGVLTFTSQSVRTALFGMDKLRSDMKQLNEEVAAKTQELIRGKALLEQNKQELQERMNEIEQIRREVETTRAELESAQAAKDATEAELATLQSSYAQVSQKLADLEATRAKMEAHIAELQNTQEQLQNGIIHLREGTILFQVDQLLAQAVVRPGLSEEDSHNAIKNIIDDTNQLVMRRLGITDTGQYVVYVDRQNVEIATQKLIGAKTPMVVQVVAAGNIIAGEPAVATIQVYPQQFIFKNGEVIHSTVMDGGSNAQSAMLQFLKQVNENAKAKGVIPDSLTGDIGTIPGDDLFAAIRRIGMMHGKVHVEAYVDGDTYSSGPVHIKLRITQMPDIDRKSRMQ
ncbi:MULTISPECIES: DUF3084 domain-containing protein [Veillonella]|uniref:DUF3084 domain-containing protein n=1 Tax=Veillonella denticariosi JCM 15641 TaxID=1298594 RepID=A0A2S7Z8K4_9FIRM|nr:MULTISPECIES: DUF3084 domain-containing protein [Veillonella]ETS92327.1 PF11283 family protein [Veillonella sp. AS16]PQL19626.1 DUF3084 domain-containing protein [Veillonella denticariosi JCM 15641]